MVNINFNTGVRFHENVPLDNKYEHTILFSNLTSQIAYFDSKVKYSFDKLSPIIAINSSFKISINPYSIYKCNYISYKNENFSDKWCYAFITEIKYISPNCAEVFFELDVLQTWLFDYQIKKSFILREHVENDSIGNHIIDENLDTGDFITIGKSTILELNDMSIVVAVTPNNTGGTSNGGLYGNIYSGVEYKAFSIEDGVGALNDYIGTITANGHNDRILSVFMCPTFLIVDLNSDVAWGVEQITRHNTLDGYIPKNNKLYTYPYHFLQASTPNSSNIYRYEYSESGELEFKFTGDYSISPTVYLIPRNYNGEVLNYDNRLSLSNYPLCSWSNDAFTSWMAQNRNSTTFQAIGNVASIVGGIATANPLLIGSGSTALISQIASTSDKATQLVEQTKGNIGGGGSALAIGLQNFFFESKCCRKQYLERIDNFFDLYGYKVAEIKIPNLKTRPNWNYIKTVNVNITGNIPFNHLSKIKDIFNSGITFWHTTDVCNYSLSNI